MTTNTTTKTTKTTKTRKLATIIRIVTGLAWLTFGLNGFFDFLPHPTTMPPAGAMAFAGALMQTGYMFKLIAVTEALVGLLLLANYVPLALVVLAPVMVNILAFHAFLDPSTIAIPVVLAALALFLAWTRRDAYRALVARAA